MPKYVLCYSVCQAWEKCYIGNASSLGKFGVVEKNVCQVAEGSDVVYNSSFGQACTILVLD